MKIKHFLFIIALILVPFVVYAWNTAIICGGTPSAGGGCDDCSGNLAVAVHFEDGSDPTDIDDPGVSPCGCTDGSDDTADLSGGAVINSNGSYVSDGSYSGQFTTYADALEIDNTGLDGALDTTGTWCADIWMTVQDTWYIFDIGASSGRVYNGAGANDNYLRAIYTGDSFTGTDTFADSTQTRICFSWDMSPADNSECLATKVGSNSWEEDCTLNGTESSTLGSPVFLVGNADQRGYVDNLKLYSTYQAE